MKIKTVYLWLCVLGTVLPYSQLLPFLGAHGLNLRLFAAQLFANRIGAFFGMDVMVSALVLCVFVCVEGRRARVRRLWLPLGALLTVGVSLALPLFLYLRERSLERPGMP